jgi:hypothetical protein
MSENPVLWSSGSDQQQATAMYRFMQQQGHDSYDDLYQWSIDEPASFWEALCDFCGVHFDTPATTTLTRPDDIMNAGWFEGSELNFAAHLLRHSGERAAIVFCGEDGNRRELSFDDLRLAVAGIAAGLRNAGVKKADRVVAYLPNCPEAIIAMLATTSIGAIWSSCSPDFGVNGVVDRFGQIEPKVLFASDGYLYNGKRIDTTPIVADIIAVRSPSLHYVFVRYDRRAKVHSARAWRLALAAPERAYAAYRPVRVRPAVLFHDLWLDDVELAGQRLGGRRHRRALRRFTVFRGGSRAVEYGRTRTSHGVRDQR